MATRQFKEAWTPTPLRSSLPQSESPKLEPLPAPEPAAPETLPDPVEKTPALPEFAVPAALTQAAAAAAQRTSAAGALVASTASSALASARASAAGTAVASAASSALATARASAAGAAIASAAGSALASARSVAGSAVSSAATGSAIAAARASAAAAVVATTVGPIPSPVGLINRTSYILKFSLKWMFRELLQLMLSTIGRKRPRSAEAGRDAREFAEKLGGMWVIIVRLTSLRGDLLGEAFCHELSLVRDISAPVPFPQIRKVVEEDLRSVGTTFEETFVEFDETPHTVRSFVQVHRARLKQNKREVLVRVRVPDALQRAKTDWRYLRLLLFVLRQLNIDPHLRWDDLMFETKKATDDLLDLRAEVEELRRLRKVLRKCRIYVPLLYRKLCTERMLVLEHIQGISVADLVCSTHQNPELCDAWMRENKINRRRIWRRLFCAHHQMLFEHNMFNTELSPSSIILLKNNRLAFVSLGTIGTLDADLRRQYRHLYRAFLTEDYSKAADYYLTLGPALPYTDISKMKQMALRALRRWESRTHVKNRPYREKSLSAAVGELARCASAQELPTFWNLARLQLAERILNTTLEFFDPTKSSLKALKRYEQSAQMRSIKNATTKKVRKRVEGAIDVAQLNMQLLENFEHDGEYLRRRLLGVQSKLSKMSAIAGRMVILGSKMVVAALAIQVFLYYKQGHALAMPWMDQSTLGRALSRLRPQSGTSWVILCLFLFYIRSFFGRLARQLFQKEVRPGDVT